MKIEAKFNGKRITNSSQLEREMLKSMDREVGESLRKVAGGSVRIKRDHDGFTVEGTPEQIERIQRHFK